MSRKERMFRFSKSKFSLLLLFTVSVAVADNFAHDAGFHEHADSDALIFSCNTFSISEEAVTAGIYPLPTTWATGDWQSAGTNAPLDYFRFSLYIARGPPHP